MALVEVDVVGAQPPEAALDGFEDVLAREPPVVGVVAHRPEAFGRQHVVRALDPLECLTQFGLAGADMVDVGGVEEDHAQLEGALDTGGAGGAVDLVAVGQPGAEGDAADLQPAGAGGRVFHAADCTLRRCPAAAPGRGRPKPGPAPAPRTPAAFAVSTFTGTTCGRRSRSPLGRCRTPTTTATRR